MIHTSFPFLKMQDVGCFSGEKKINWKPPQVLKAREDAD